MPYILTTAKMNITDGVMSAGIINEYIKSKGSDVATFVENIGSDTNATKKFEQHLVHTYNLRVADFSGCGKFYLVCNLSMRDFMKFVMEVNKSKPSNKITEFKVPPKPVASHDLD